MNNKHYNKSLKGLGRALRSKMTKSEASLWKYALKSSQRGVGFKRQRPIDSFIVDFVCLELKLVIELDGITHQYPEVIEKDKLKDKKLNTLGFVVLRFDDSEVLNDINAVIRSIDNAIEELRKGPPPPRTSAPPPEEDSSNST